MRHDPRVLIYAAGVAGVGQTSRAVHLAEYVCSVFDAAAVLVVTGVPDGDRLFSSDGVQVASLEPVVELVDAVRQGHHGGEVADAVAATSALLSVADEFDPDVLIATTHAGLGGELRPLLKRLDGTGRRRVLALRDVYWPPRFADEFERLSTGDFDTVIVGGPPEISSWIPAGLLRGELANSLSFVGYLRPIEDARLESATTSPVVRCQVGGGRDGYALAAALIDAAPKLHERQPSSRVHVSTGPLMSDQDRRRLRSATHSTNVVVEPWIVDPFGAVASTARPAMVVSMAGYNACVEAAWSGTPTILCPRRRDDDSEQQIRAHLFADWFDNITVVDRPEPNALLRAVSEPPPLRVLPLEEAQLAIFAELNAVASLLLGEAS